MKKFARNLIGIVLAALFVACTTDNNVDVKLL